MNFHKLIAGKVRILGSSAVSCCTYVHLSNVVMAIATTDRGGGR